MHMESWRSRETSQASLGLSAPEAEVRRVVGFWPKWLCYLGELKEGAERYFPVPAPGPEVSSAHPEP